jgi:hypothetical protein
MIPMSNDTLGGPYYDPRSYGARGDGQTLNTAALQQAIDDCHAAGGGTVVVPPGVYLTGTLSLQSHVTLHLSPGAVLRGSPRREDYNPDDVFPENRVFASENVTGAHLILAYQAENVAITGEGTIDGNSAAFFEPLPPEEVTPSYRLKTKNFPIRDWRPGQMVFFCRCRNVSVRDVSLINSPYWTCFLLGCSQVRLRGLRIDNPPQTQNGDGLDVDCCRDVTISDCLIQSGDDSITLRGNGRALGDAAQPCENVVVTNCVLSSPCNALRIGVGDGVVRDCSINNLVIRESRTGINLVSRYYSSGEHGTLIENVSFSNLVMDTLCPLHLVLGGEAQPPAAISNLRFSHLRAIARQGCCLEGNPGHPITGLSLTDIDLVMTGGSIDPAFVAAVPEPYAVNSRHLGLPFGLFARHLEDLRIRNLRVTWDQPEGPWQHAVAIEKSTGVTLEGLDLQPPPGDPARAALHVSEVANLRQ